MILCLNLHVAYCYVQRFIECPGLGLPGIVNFTDARTQWFDQGVESALDEGITQVSMQHEVNMHNTTAAALCCLIAVWCLTMVLLLLRGQHPLVLFVLFV